MIAENNDEALSAESLQDQSEVTVDNIQHDCSELDYLFGRKGSPLDQTVSSVDRSGVGNGEINHSGVPEKKVPSEDSRKYTSVEPEDAKESFIWPKKKTKDSSSDLTWPPKKKSKK